SIQKLYKPNNDPRISPANTVLNSVNPHPKTNKASNKYMLLRCFKWISCKVSIIIYAPVFLFLEYGVTLLRMCGVVPASLSSLITGEDSEKGWNLSKFANELPF